jgi:hypothetical protein
VADFVTARSCCAAIGASGNFCELLRGRPVAYFVNVGVFLFDDWGPVAQFVTAYRAMTRWGPVAGSWTTVRCVVATMGTNDKSSRTVGFCYKRFVDKIWAQSRTSRNRWLLFNKFVHILIDELFTTSRLILVASIWNISVQDNINTPALRNSLMFQAKQVSLAVCQDFHISKDSSVS